MYRVLRLFAVTAFAVFLSFPARADAPEGWKEDERFKLLGREAYQIEDPEHLALVERAPVPDGSPEEWLKGYIEDKVSKYTIKKLIGPNKLRDDAKAPIEGGYMANVILTNEKNQTLIMTFAMLIKEDAQVWQIFWNKDLKGSAPLVLKALNFVAKGGSTDSPLEEPKSIDQVLSALKARTATVCCRTGARRSQ